MPQPPKVIHLDEIEPVPGPGSLRWLPVRRELGIKAFGTNAYIAAEAGDDVVEPHAEAAEDSDPADGHQELYFVARGRATFEVDGQRHDAPAGTYVFIPDAASHRHAVAEEAGTTVLSFGGPPSFTPSPWEWAFLAAPLLHAEPERARALLAEGLTRHPNAGDLLYTLACLEAIQGDRDAALDALTRAVAQLPHLREHAADDEDLVSLRDDPRFQRLTAGP
ncbi:MAG TPA: cupin domain-containing protein [Solirubrobacteraceae bacterium]|nr:cupin domain-containing protein [Solirubrobacteraceae bacterium]